MTADPSSITSTTTALSTKTTPGNIIYNCRQDETNLIARETVSVSESTTFSAGAAQEVNLGLNAIVTAGTKFGLNQNTGSAQIVTQQETTGASALIQSCEGLGIQGEYKTYQKFASQQVYGLVSYYTCTCTVDFGGGNVAVFEDAPIKFLCFPQSVRAESTLAQDQLSVMLVSAAFDPPPAPADGSPSACDWCEDDGLDPDGDDDGDGTKNSEDDTPYGYEGDDPYGDADGDGVPNCLDPTPYGYDGNDPYGDDDGDGIPNCQDPTPYGDSVFEFFPVPGGAAFKLPTYVLS